MYPSSCKRVERVGFVPQGVRAVATCGCTEEPHWILRTTDRRTDRAAVRFAFGAFSRTWIVVGLNASCGTGSVLSSVTSCNRTGLTLGTEQASSFDYSQLVFATGCWFAHLANVRPNSSSGENRGKLTGTSNRSCIL